MPNAGRGAALARDSEDSRIEMSARAYLAYVGGDPGAALRCAIEDALAAVAAAERRADRAERFVSRGFVRGAFHPSAR
jgi:hypothetical protein